VNCEACGVGFLLPSGECDHCGTNKRSQAELAEIEKLKTACAQMREALENIERQFAEKCEATCMFQNDLLSIEQARIALSTDCGKGMVPIEDLKGLFTALRHGDSNQLVQELAALERKHGDKLK